MIKDSERGTFDAVIMYTLDRFARNRYDSAIYKARLKKNGVSIYYAKQPMPDTPEGIILESVLEGYAEYYSENLSRNIKRGIVESVKKGLALGGTTPLGYYVGNDRKYHVDPAGSKIVQEIYQRYADGYTCADIISYCNSQGYKTNKGKPFHRTALTTILKNEKYIGTYRVKDIVIPDCIPTIIDKGLFEKVQSMRKHNYTARAKSKAREDYLLTTKVFCGHCGERMVGESGKSHNGTVYNYYKCAARKRGEKCDKKAERKDWLEEFVVKHIVETLLTDETIEMIASEVVRIYQNEFTDTAILDSHKARLKEVEGRIENIISAIEEGIYTDTTKDRLLKLENEKKDLTCLIEKEEEKKPPLTKEHVIYWLSSFKDGNINDTDYKRRIIDTLLNSIFIYDLPGKGRKFVFTFNTSDRNTSTLTCSDIEQLSPLDCGYSNLFLSHKVFGYSVILRK